MAVISLGGIVSSDSVRVGGNKFDAAISEFIRRKYNLAIGEHTAENIKIEIGSAMYLENKLAADIKGRDMVTGLPKILRITSDDITDAIQEELRVIADAIKEVLRRTPPELCADVMDRGMMLSGGTSQLRNLDRLIAEATGVPTYVADDPVLCVVKGTGIALENLDSYKRSILATK